MGLDDFHLWRMEAIAERGELIGRLNQINRRLHLIGELAVGAFAAGVWWLGYWLLTGWGVGKSLSFYVGAALAICVLGVLRRELDRD